MDKKFTYQKVVTVVCMLVSLFAVIIHVGNYTTFTMPSILFLCLASSDRTCADFSI